MQLNEYQISEILKAADFVYVVLAMACYIFVNALCFLSGTIVSNCCINKYFKV